MSMGPQKVSSKKRMFVKYSALFALLAAAPLALMFEILLPVMAVR